MNSKALAANAAERAAGAADAAAAAAEAEAAAELEQHPSSEDSGWAGVFGVAFGIFRNGLGFVSKVGGVWAGYSLVRVGVRGRQTVLFFGEFSREPGKQ